MLTLPAILSLLTVFERSRDNSV